MKPDLSAHSKETENLTSSLTNRQRKIIYSPLRLVLTLGVSIFVIEFLDMFLIENINGLTKTQEILLDATLLTVALIPILFFYLFRPLVHLIHDYKQNEIQLKTYQNHLEQKVTERTSDLEGALARLKKKNEINYTTKMALIESEARFRQLFDQSEDAVILIAQDGTIIDSNPTAESIFRKRKEEILSGGLEVLCAQGDQLPRLNSILEQITSHGIPHRIDRFEYTIAPGEVRILSFRGKAITLQGARVAYTTFRDITTRVRLEEEALDIQARLIQANRMTSLGTMVSSVAHEINNPNNFLLMNAKIIDRAWPDIIPIIENHYQHQGDFSVARSTWSEARIFLPEAIEGLRQGALRISAIVGSLKEFGRDNRFSSQSRADVNAVVQLSASILNHHISRATHNFKLELAEGLPKVKGSARQLEQVVINLIQNALQALPDPKKGVRITTGSDAESGDIFIQVIDEGNGIPPEIANRIMEPFFTTRLEFGGTGLGLAISSTIVKEQGGSIGFFSEVGKGTTFTVRLCREIPANTTAPHEEHHDNC